MAKIDDDKYKIVPATINLAFVTFNIKPNLALWNTNNARSKTHHLSIILRKTRLQYAICIQSKVKLLHKLWWKFIKGNKKTRFRPRKKTITLKREKKALDIR